MRHVGNRLMIVGLIVQFTFLCTVTFANSDTLEAIEDNESRVFDAPGIFGSEQIEVIKGDVIVGAPGITLRNMVMEGSLIISDKIRTGTVVLEGTTVENEAKISAAGNTRIVFKDALIKKVRVVGADQVTVEAVGASRIDLLIMSSSAHIIETDLRASGFIDLLTETEFRVKLSKTSLRRMTINKNLSDLDLLSGTFLEELRINAPLERGFLNANTVIEKCIFNSPAKIEGDGSVIHAVVNVGNVQMVYPPDIVELKTGVGKPQYTRTYAEIIRPSDNSYNISLDPDISVVFSKAVKLSTVRAELMLNLRENAGYGRLVTLTGSGSTSGGKSSVNARPLMSLMPDHVYSLGFDNVLDAAGKPVLGNREVLFRTKSAAKPIIASTIPHNLSNDAPVGTEIELNFSKVVRLANNTPLSEENIETVVFLRRNTVNGPLEPYSAKIVTELGQTRVKILTDYYLNPNTEYFLSVVGLEDSLDQVIEGQKTFTFKTAAANTHAMITGFSHTHKSMAEENGAKVDIVISQKVMMPDDRPITSENLQELIELRMGNIDGHPIPFSGQVRYDNGKMILTVFPVAELTPETTYYIVLGDMVDEHFMDVMGQRIYAFVAK